jgi:aryl-alcohol dehydrogenase-like predicted oxidoreductase
MGLSETRIGRLLKHRRKDFYLATKCGSRVIFEEGKEPRGIRDFTYDGLIASVQDSLKRMQTDYVDVLQFHTATVKALETNGEALAALIEMKKRGYCRFLGASCDGERAIEAINTGILDCIQISFNLAAQDPIKKILPLAQKENIGVIIKEPVANVFFMGIPKPGEDYSWQYATWDRCQDFLFLKDIAKPKPVQAALQFVLAHAAVTTAIAASVTVEHMKDNLAVPDLPTLDEKLMKKIIDTYDEKVKFTN